MADPEVIDAAPVDEPGTDLATRDAQPVSLFNTDDPVDVLSKASRVADALKDAVDRQGMIQNIAGKPHAKVEAWQTLGSMLGVTAVCVHTEETTDRHGKPAYKATVEARYRGEVVGQADALCSTSENRWKTADDYALLSMAQTRATSKALKGPLGWVMKLAGYESTPAEEMPHEPAKRASAPPRIDQDTYQDLVAKFHASNRTVEQLAEWLDCPENDVGPEVGKLSPARAKELDAWLAAA